LLRQQVGYALLPAATPRLSRSLYAVDYPCGASRKA
jgi:hypothetical protein